MRILLFFSFLLLLVSCSNDDAPPDVSDIPMNVEISRFDQQFFALDTNNLESGLQLLRNQYPQLLPLYLGNILGLDSATLREGISNFIRLSAPIQDSINRIYRGMEQVEEDLENSFRYVRHYFPDYKLPRVIAVNGPVDVLAQTRTGEYTPAFLGPGFLGISLQFYLGKNFSLYNQDYFVARVAPMYRSRRFSREYVAADAMKVIVDDLYPDNSPGNPLIVQIIEKGKQWWLLDKLMPFAPDSVITGYTQNHLDFSERNEGLIWQTIITNEKNLFTIEPVSIQTYIGESPYTLNMGDNSPGNIGQWVGWQIVQEFADKNPDLTLDEVMKTDASKIFEGAKYKPK